jgi:pimeloyl-ACP methyl ester carboxylesterase
MPRATNGSVEIEYEVRGDSSAPLLLLCHGFTTQLVSWDPAFLDELVEAGLRIAIFDNRDAGLSTGFDGIRPRMADIVAALKAGTTPDIPYTLADMANDAIAVLDAIGDDKAHVAGASMGGMIVQRLAIDHPTRIASMTSMMSTTGDRDVGQATPEANAALMGAPPAERDAFIEHTITVSRVYASKAHYSPERIRARASREYDRAFRPEGALRQLAAIVADGSRSEALRHIDLPAFVMHGLDDTLIPPSGGRRTAEVIPGAELFELADWGHDWPAPLVGVLAATLAGFVNAHAV